ncbi:MAG: hypothetical protein HZA62_07520 [Rhodocyclales bacterium]|nr:hypothetical protein [Rhodocyclales bacterium]
MNTDDFANVPLASVAPGARLAAAVVGADGHVLMTAGSQLTEAILEGLAARGVVAVAIEAPRGEPELAAARDGARQRLVHLFRGCDLDEDGGAARMLFDAVLERRLEDLR